MARPRPTPLLQDLRPLFFALDAVAPPRNPAAPSAAEPAAASSRRRDGAVPMDRASRSKRALSIDALLATRRLERLPGRRASREPDHLADGQAADIIARQLIDFLQP